MQTNMDLQGAELISGRPRRVSIHTSAALVAKPWDGDNALPQAYLANSMRVDALDFGWSVLHLNSGGVQRGA